jgi:hypothetical protein
MFSERMKYGIWENGPVIMALIAGLVFIIPQIFEVLLISYYLIWKVYHKAPYPEGMPVRSSPKQDSSVALYCMGMEVSVKKPVWFSDSQMRQHMLVMGTTGAGKTEFLLWLSAQAMAMGSGVIFVDGKGDVKTWFRLFSIAKRLGCEESMRVLNFGTNMGEGEMKYSLSNTINPFTLGDAGQLAEMMSSLMAEAGGDNAMWKGRAESMMRALLTALVDLRNIGAVDLGPGALTDWLPLDQLSKLETDERLSDLARLEVKRYLDTLPGFRAGGQGKAESDKQHGFLTMQFTEILGLFNNAYGHIMSFKLGEIDMYDIITNRRSLYVMLPSMEKSGNSIKNLGKIVVNQIRAALSKTLGAGIKGTREQKLDARPTNSKTPMLCILDEYGSYAVEGFGEVAAQARSIGFSTCFAVQDWASLEKADSKGNEALRIWANTNIKIIMKVEDSKSTMPLVIERVKKGYVLESSGKEYNKDSTLGGERNQSTSRYHEVDRLDPLDLFRLKNGRFFVIYENKFHEVQAPWLSDTVGAWSNTAYVAPIRLVPVPPPSVAQIEKAIQVSKNFADMLQNAMGNANLGEGDIDGVSDDIRESAESFRSAIAEAHQYDGDPARAGLETVRMFIRTQLQKANRRAQNLFSADGDESESSASEARSHREQARDAGDMQNERDNQLPWNSPAAAYTERDDHDDQYIHDNYTMDEVDEDEPLDDYPEHQNKEMKPMEKEEYVQGALQIAKPDNETEFGKILNKTLSGEGWLEEDEDETKEKDE